MRSGLKAVQRNRGGLEDWQAECAEISTESRRTHREEMEQDVEWKKL